MKKEDVVLVDVCKIEKQGAETYGDVKNYNVVCLKFEHGYVPVKHISGLKNYIKTMASEEYNNKFLACQNDKYICSVPNGGGYYSENVRQAFKEKGHVDMEVLKTLDTLCQSFKYSIFQDELDNQPEAERE